MSNPSEKGMMYVRMYGDLLSHPKFIDLMDFLREKGEKFTERDVWGSIGLMWDGTAKYFSDGQIHDDHDVIRRIGRMSRWHGDLAVWVDGLKHARFLEKNEKGFYVWNWMEKHAREWWQTQGKYADKKAKARARAAKSRANKARMAEENKILRDKMGLDYDASPLIDLKSDPKIDPKNTPKNDPKNDPRAPLSREKSVTHAPVTLRARSHAMSQKGPILPPPFVTLRHPQNLPPPVIDEKMKSAQPEQTVTPLSREKSVTHAPVRVVTLCHTPHSSSSSLNKDNYLEASEPQNSPASRVPKPDLPKTVTKEANPKMEQKTDPKKRTPQQALADYFKTRLEEKLGEPTTEQSFNYGRVVPLIIELLYDRKTQKPKFTSDEIKRRMGHWFDSTFPYVPNNHWSFYKFNENFNRFKDGPWVGKGGRDDGGMDKPRNIETKDDF